MATLDAMWAGLKAGAWRRVVRARQECAAADRAWEAMFDAWEASGADRSQWREASRARRWPRAARDSGRFIGDAMRRSISFADPLRD